MILKHRKKLRSILMGLLAIKITITLFYLTGSLNLVDTIFPQQVAVAQETTAAPSDEAQEKQTSADEKKSASAAIHESLNSLEVKRMRIAKEEARLKAQRAQLEALEIEILEKVEQNEKILKKIEEGLAAQEKKARQLNQQQKQGEAAKMKQLVKVYTSMKPKTAAALINKLDMAVVLKLFSHMKGEQIGQILTYVDSARAAQISEQLAARSFGKGGK